MPIVRCLFLLATLSGVPACNPGLDEGEGGLPTLTLLETRPARDDRQAEIGTALRMVFNEKINPLTVSSESVVVSAEGNQRVAGGLEVADRVIEFRPASLLRLSTPYQVRLENTVRSIRDNFLPTPDEWSFSTRPGAFGPSRLMAAMDRTDGRFQMDVAFDHRGTAWAVWLDYSTTVGDQIITPHLPAVVLSRYEAVATTWKVVRRIEAADRSELAFTPLLWDQNSNGYLVWVERGDAGDQVHVVRLDVLSQTWEDLHAFRLPADRRLDFPKCVIDSSDDVHVLWLEQSKTSSEIRKVSFAHRQGQWSEASTLVRGALEIQLVGILDILVGDRVTVYYVTQSPDLVLLGSVDLQGGAEAIAGELPRSFSSMTMTYNERGAAFLSWINTRSAEVSLEVMSYGREQGWSSPRQLTSASGSQVIVEPHLAVDPAGNALVSWITREGATENIYYARFASATRQWATPVLFRSFTPQTGHASHGVAMLGDEHPIVSWSVDEGGGGAIWSSERTAPTAAWTAPYRLSQHQGTIRLPERSPSVAATGRAVPFWLVETRLTREIGGVMVGFTHQEIWGTVFQ